MGMHWLLARLFFAALALCFSSLVHSCKGLNISYYLRILVQIFNFLHKLQPITYLLKDHSWRVYSLWSVLVPIGANAQLPVSIVAPCKQFSTLGEGQGRRLSTGY